MPQEIDSYLEWRKRWGERIEPDSPLFRREYNATIDLESPNIKPLGSNAIRFFIQRLLTDTGLRTHEPLMEGKTPKRHVVMMNHGFRKFFETNSFKAGMNNIYLRRLMGQKSQLEEEPILGSLNAFSVRRYFPYLQTLISCYIFVKNMSYRL